MNIAILIGVSKYKSEAALPACEFDVDNMRRLLVATKKYDDIYCITDQTDASQVKDRLRGFFAKYQGNTDIAEALIYFSGHGVYQNDALLCCSDFDGSRPSTTSVSNSELDDLLRSVKPDVAVKIIDACQSGSPYIKEASAGFEKALGASKLNAFICMSSSRQDQSSYATLSESAFTAKWIDAALAKQQGHVLYRDIQAALADAFVTNPDQTPFFVSQGTGLEVFSSVTDEMGALVIYRSKAAVVEKPAYALAQIIEAEVSKRDGQFVSHQAAVAAIEASKLALVNEPIADPVVAKFYKVKVSTDTKLSSLPKSRSVADFAHEQAWSKRYFTKINQEQYKARVLKDPLTAFASIAKLSASYLKRDESDYIFETRLRPSTLESTEPLPFEVADLSFTSAHPSLPAFILYIGVVHSLTDVMILSSTVRLSQKGWTEKAPDLSEVQWRYQNYPWTEVVSNPLLIWRDALARGTADIRAYLEALAPKSDPSAEAGAVDQGGDGTSGPAA